MVAAGDYASIHRGLEELIDMLVVIEPPTVVVPGNNQTEEVCVPRAPAGAPARVLDGDGTKIDGVPFFGLGGAAFL